MTIAGTELHAEVVASPSLNLAALSSAPMRAGTAPPASQRSHSILQPSAARRAVGANAPVLGPSLVDQTRKQAPRVRSQRAVSPSPSGPLLGSTLSRQYAVSASASSRPERPLSATASCRTDSRQHFGAAAGTQRPNRPQSAMGLREQQSSFRSLNLLRPTSASSAGRTAHEAASDALQEFWPSDRGLGLRNYVRWAVALSEEGMRDQLPARHEFSLFVDRPGVQVEKRVACSWK